MVLIKRKPAWSSKFQEELSEAPCELLFSLGMCLPSPPALPRNATSSIPLLYLSLSSQLPGQLRASSFTRLKVAFFSVFLNLLVFFFLYGCLRLLFCVVKIYDIFFPFGSESFCFFSVWNILHSQHITHSYQLNGRSNQYSNQSVKTDECDLSSMLSGTGEMSRKLKALTIFFRWPGFNS